MSNPGPFPLRAVTGAYSHPTVVDISSSSEDESWGASAQRDRGRVENLSISSAPRFAKKHPTKFKPAMPTISTNSPSGSGANSKAQVSRPSTPQNSSRTPAGTPSGRSFAIEAAFQKIELSSASQTLSSTPSPSKNVMEKRKVVVIDSDSEEEDLATDEEPTSSPTRPLFQRKKGLTADSSLSSVSSPFTPVSATSSFSSVSSSTGAPSTTTPQSIRVGNFSTLQPLKAALQLSPPSSTKVYNSVPVIPSSSPTTALEAVAEFARSSICSDLDQHIIAHHEETQRMMDDNMISWGTQFELARGVSTGAWTWTDVQARILKLQGRNVDSAVKVQQVMKDRPVPDSMNMTIWKELDREQNAIMENKGRGLGLMGEWEGVKNWYGGQIQQISRVIKDRHSAFKIILEPLEKRRSHRYGRFYGSRRFVQLRVPDDFLQKDNERIRQFLCKKFLLCGRVYYPFHAKEGSMYLVETNEDCGSTSRDWSGDQFRMSFPAFLNWHNPFEENCRQKITKYATRFALGLSNSVPALEFKQENIFFIDDITTEDWPQDREDPPADKLMTDGCGLINHAALHAIVKHMGYESLPAGVQGRIAGGKGFWILHPTEASLEPKIWIRKSQNKIHYRTFHRAHLILDLLAPSRPSPPIALTQQSILNVFHNGISAETLVRLMEEGLEEEVAPLLDWEKPHAMVFLWDAINKAGNVSGTRTQRVSVALNRALGLKGRDWGRDEADEIDSAPGSQPEDKPSTAYTGRNVYSGVPLALHEVALELVQSGFHPGHNKLLNSKIHYIVKGVIDSSVEKYRIPIPESLGAYIVPDPLNVLEEGEVYYRFSKPRKDPRTEMLVHCLQGEILVGRYPIRLPSDMQKVTAVDRRELDKWPDVFIISVKGFRSLANMLADGDMDGDEGIIIFDPDIVAAFENKPLTKIPEDLIDANFQPNAKVATLQKFCSEVPSRPHRQTSEEFMRTLIGNLSDSQVGLYSMMHESALVSRGYDNPETIRLAYIFSTLLDASKTGHRLIPGLKDRDLKKYPKHKIDEFSTPSQKDILGMLKRAARTKGEQLIQEYQSKVVDETQLNRPDKDLMIPYSQAFDYATQVKHDLQITAFEEELGKIRRHVYGAYDLFKAAYPSSSASTQGSPVKKGRKFGKSKPDDLMLACARAYAQPIEDIKHTTNVEQVKASFAYHCAKTSSFPFTVAFQELCHIKVMACSGGSGGHAPTLRIFDEAKSFSGSFLRALRSCEEEK